MKPPRKVYLEPAIEAKLKSKAEEVGIIGRAWLSRYLEKIALEDIAFLSCDLKKILKLFTVTTT